MGQCHMDTGRYREAGKYLKAAIKSFEWLRINWKRSTAYGCFALLKAGEGDFRQAYDYMEKQFSDMLPTEPILKPDCGADQKKYDRGRPDD